MPCLLKFVIKLEKMEDEALTYIFPSLMLSSLKIVETQYIKECIILSYMYIWTVIISFVYKLYKNCHWYNKYHYMYMFVI